MAGITHLQEFSKETLRGFVDESLEARVPTVVDRYMKNDVTYDTNFAYDIIKRSNHIAAMIGLGAEKPVVDRHATAKVMGELAHFGLQDVITIEELYAINQARNSGEQAAMVDKLLNRAADLLDALDLRIQVEKMKAVGLGKNVYNKNGVKVELDYQIPANHKIVLTSGNDWNDVNRDVIGDLLTWDKTYRDTNKKKADAIWMTREMLSKLTKNVLIIAEAGRPAGSTRASEAEVRTVLAGFGLPEIVIIEDTEATVKDIETGNEETIEFFPKNRVVFISEGVGEFLTGPNPDDANFAPVRTLEAFDLRTPKRSIFEVAQTGFAVVDNPSLLLHADVVPA
ncbi:major capsid protein [Sporosarcina sp. ACRSL]|uniref:major capsid protein n=1 Tax=Sporosarcina sp. ACRSL TaxID=2918215 RepID=UPI001EF61087|nr:major capsid protein [Sporosarcina sp. ACRSL]MCG7345315.1 major capsid protein [Sporosarcina sp. ACRSL]